MNTACIVGNLGADPELRHTPDNVPFCKFSVAVPREYKKPDGTRPVDWLRCVAWGPNAEYLAKYGAKGRVVAVTGQIRVDEYTDRDTGEMKRIVEIKAASVNLVDRKRESGSVGRGVDVSAEEFEGG